MATELFLFLIALFFRKKQIKKDKGELIIYSWPSEKRPTSIKDAIWFAKLYFMYKPNMVVGHFVGANITIGISKLLSFTKVKTFAYYHTLMEQINLDNQNTSTFKRKILFLRKKMFYKFFCDVIVCPSELALKILRKTIIQKMD